MQERNGLFAPIIDALSGNSRRDAPSRRQQPAPIRPDTQHYTEDRAQTERRAARQRDGEMAIRRAQAASSRPLTEQQIASIRSRYQ